MDLRGGGDPRRRRRDRLRGRPRCRARPVRGRLGRARLEVRRGRFEAARATLSALPSWRLDDPEAADLLATSEHAAGRYEAALAAWSRIPPDSPRAASIALARARTLVGNLGRFADAEAILEAALRPAPGPARLEIAHTLSQLYFFESRPGAMRRLILGGRADWRDPPSELRDLWLIDDATVLVDEVRRAVETAEARAPEDDRVWLARAGLELRDQDRGPRRQAGRRLDALPPPATATTRRPGWSKPGRWARATGDGRGASGQGAGTGSRPTRCRRVRGRSSWRAWFAADGGRRGRAPPSRPGAAGRARPSATPPTLDRLAEARAVRAWSRPSRNDEAASLRRRKAEVDRRLAPLPGPPGGRPGPGRATLRENWPGWRRPWAADSRPRAGGRSLIANPERRRPGPPRSRSALARKLLERSPPRRPASLAGLTLADVALDRP